MSGDYGRPKGPLTDASGYAPMTSTLVLSADPYRKVLLMQNLDPEADIWVGFGSAATQGPGSFLIPAGQMMKFDDAFCVTNSMYVISGGNGLAGYTLKTSS